jgi:hypothetical protein
VSRRAGNFLALNLMHDIVTGQKTVEEARQYYATEFTDARRKEPTPPYMEKLRCPPGHDTADPDVPVLSDGDCKNNGVTPIMEVAPDD